MTRQTELALTVEVQVLLVGRVVDAVARQAVDRLTVARIPDFLAHGVRHLVLVGVAAAAELDGTGHPQERLLTAVSGVAGRAIETIAVTEVTPGLPRAGATRIVAGETESLLWPAQETLAVSRVRIVTDRTAAAAGTHMGHGSVAARLHLLLMAITAQAVESCNRAEGLGGIRRLVAVGAVTAVERGMQTLAEKARTARSVGIVAGLAAGIFHRVLLMGGPESGIDGMASGARLIAGSWRQMGQLSRVGLVTDEAFAFAERPVADRLLSILVAGKAQVGPGRHQELVMAAAMGLVTGRAAALGHRSMDLRTLQLGGQRGVAGSTKRPRPFPEQALKTRNMGIVAGRTFALLRRRMRHRGRELRPEIVVTLETGGLLIDLRPCC